MQEPINIQFVFSFKILSDSSELKQQDNNTCKRHRQLPTFVKRTKVESH